MNRFILTLTGVLAVVGQAHADLQAPARMLQSVTDPSLVVMDRGAKLEVFPTKRATAQTDGSGRTVSHHVATASADAPIGQHQLGVVFNHALQQQGYITGEIAFKMKAGYSGTGLSHSLYPGLKKITSPEVYVVNARTPAEFLSLMKRLQGRHDVEWVEPTVVYAPVDSNPTTR
jgi:hypothetical protein